MEGRVTVKTTNKSDLSRRILVINSLSNMENLRSPMNTILTILYHDYNFQSESLHIAFTYEIIKVYRKWQGMCNKMNMAVNIDKLCFLKK